MRTTITIDDDVASKLKPLLERSRGRSKKVINELLRKALGIEKQKKVQFPVFNLGNHAGVDQTSFNKLGEELALEEDLTRLKNENR